MSHDLPKEKQQVFFSFDLLPEARKWQIGKVYRIRAVLKQVSTSEDGAYFEIVDASSLEPMDKSNRHYLSEGGIMKG